MVGEASGIICYICYILYIVYIYIVYIYIVYNMSQCPFGSTAEVASEVHESFAHGRRLHDGQPLSIGVSPDSLPVSFEHCSVGLNGWVDA